MITPLLLAAAVLCAPAEDGSWLPADYQLRNLGQHVISAPATVELPIAVPPFVEHVRDPRLVHTAEIAAGATGIMLDDSGEVKLETLEETLPDGARVLAKSEHEDKEWLGTDRGLYYRDGDGQVTRHTQYGVEGPLASYVTAFARTDDGTLWVGTPLGLSVYRDGAWQAPLRGAQGLPVESVAALAASGKNLWIGTHAGAIYYEPDAEGRRWYYRAGQRYLPNDEVRGIATAPAHDAVWFLTGAGVSRLELRSTTLLEKAETIERVLNERHRRQGLVAASVLDDPLNPTSHEIPDNDNDGLWTAYHVAAMSLCYGATGDRAALDSARTGMHALYMLQNVSGTPGLVARSVLPADIGSTKGAQWRPTGDGKTYWKSDTSSDEIDGHYLAFYTYFEHIARHDEQERALIDRQVREVTDYIVGNGYQLIDWDGKRTRWGFWDPPSLNHNPMDFIEMGLNSLQILSFLKVAHHITGDAKYHEHYRSLAVDHHYLENIMLVKKAFPLENNHSDDQLGFVAWYPILQLERDPRARQALLRGVNYHYEVVRPEQPSFYTFVYATVNPGDADLPGAVENLRQIPTDRRNWAQRNSHRADVTADKHPNRFGDPVITRVLPADERHFAKWNGDPYEPDTGGDGRVEDDGAAYLLPYWLGRYHGFLAE